MHYIKQAKLWFGVRFFLSDLLVLPELDRGPGVVDDECRPFLQVLVNGVCVVARRPSKQHVPNVMTMQCLSSFITIVMVVKKDCPRVVYLLSTWRGASFPSSEEFHVLENESSTRSSLWNITANFLASSLHIGQIFFTGGPCARTVLFLCRLNCSRTCQ